jgi:hypothetical protein
VNRTTAYLAANLLFLLAVVVGSLQASSSSVHPLYLLALFALCSSPLLFMQRLNDRYALLGLFSAVYFLFFGVLDFIHLVSGTALPPASDEILSTTELVILVGGVLAHAAYRLACGFTRKTSRQKGRDWPETTLVLAGGSLWIVSTWLTWRFRVYVIVNTSVHDQHLGLASAGAIMSAVYMVAAYLQPLGLLILAYTQSKYRRTYMLPVLVAAVLMQLLMGFVVDIKGEALAGFAIVLLTKLLMEGRIPRQWLVTCTVFIAIAWPVLQANRTVRGQYNMSHAEAAAHLLETLERAMEAKSAVMKGPDRANTLFERMSMKGSVEMIVSGTDHGTHFQNGYTLSPIVAAFIPRLVWRDKPDVQTGLILNKEFQVSEVEDTYISPSHLGELYWNFGWAGVIAGMPLIGLLLGYIGGRYDLSESVTLTRVMVIVVTLKLIVLGFESAIAPQYVMWMRSMLAIGLLDLLLARATIAERNRQAVSETTPQSDKNAAPYLPNLMR